VSGDTVTLSWTAASTPDAASSYVIEAGSSPGAANLASFDTGTAATGLTVRNVPQGTYFVRVRASNNSGVGAPSNEIVVNVGGSGGCVAAPSAPTNLNGAVNASSVTLTWGAPGAGCPATTYVIEAGSASGQSNLANFNTGTAATTYSTSNVPNGTYFVRVRGSNGATVGTASNEVILTVGAAPATGVAGRWVGLVANGDGYMSSTFCDERFDWQLDLAQTGSAVTGTLTQKDVMTCPGDPSGRTVTAPLSGTASNGNFSFTITTHEGRAIAASVTFTGSRMTGTTAGPTVERGTVRLNKQ
jgi:predicted phage tail protein